MHSEETSEGEVLLIPRIGHKALILLASWMAKRDEPEANTHPMDGIAGRSASTPRGADQQLDTKESVNGSGDRP